MKKILLAIIFAIIILLITSIIFIGDKNNRYYSINIEITPENMGEYTIYIPAIYFDNDELLDFNEYITYFSDYGDSSIINTEFGFAFKISSDNNINIKTKNPILKKHPGLWITLEKSNDQIINDRITLFYVFLNSTTNTNIYINYMFETFEKGGSHYKAKISFKGYLTNGWNLLNGTIIIKID